MKRLAPAVLLLALLALTAAAPVVTQPATRPDSATQKVRQQLARAVGVPLEFQGVKFGECAAFVSNVSNLTIRVDEESIRAAGLDPAALRDAPVNLALPQTTPAATALALLAAQVGPGLAYDVAADGAVVFVAAPGDADDQAQDQAPPLPGKAMGVPLNLDNVPFADVLTFLRRQPGLTLNIDAGGLRRAGIDPTAVRLAETSLSVPATTPAGEVLRRTMAQAHPDLRAFVHRDGGVVVTTRQGLGRWRDHIARDPDAPSPPAKAVAPADADDAK